MYVNLIKKNSILIFIPFKPILKRNSNVTNELLIIKQWHEIVELVHNKTLFSHINSLKSLVENKLLFLAIFGIENYFRYQKKPMKKYDKLYGKSPKISRRDLEYSLTELQLFCPCCYRFVEKDEDLASLITQFTKSIAQVPFK